MVSPLLSVVNHRIRSAVLCLVFTACATIASVVCVTSSSFSYSSMSSYSGDGGEGVGGEERGVEVTLPFPLPPCVGPRKSVSRSFNLRIASHFLRSIWESEGGDGVYAEESGRAEALLVASIGGGDAV